MVRLDFRRMALTAATVALVGVLCACGPVGSSSTTVVLTGPPDKVDAMVARHAQLGPPAEARKETLGDGSERASFHLPKGLPMGEVIALSKEAARDGVSFEFSSGTQWGSDAPGQGGPATSDPAKTPARPAGGPVV